MFTQGSESSSSESSSSEDSDFSSIKCTQGSGSTLTNAVDSPDQVSIGQNSNISSMMLKNPDYISLFNREVFSSDVLMKKIAAVYPNYPAIKDVKQLPSAYELAKLAMPYINRFVAVLALSGQTDRYAIKIITEDGVSIVRKERANVKLTLTAMLPCNKSNRRSNVYPIDLIDMYPHMSLVVQQMIFRPFPPKDVTSTMSSVYKSNGTLYLNSYSGLKWSYDECIAAYEKDLNDETGMVSTYFEHLHKIFCNGDDAIFNWIIRWFAQKFQSPHVKHHTSPVSIGNEGSGKGVTLRVILDAFGANCITVKMKEIGSKFNAFLDEKMLVYIEELNVDSKREMDNLKHMITQTEDLINGKYQSKRKVKFYADFLFSTNHEDSLRLTGKSRRWCVFETNNKYSTNGKLQGSDYFDRFMKTMGLQSGRENYQGVKAVAGYLLKLNIGELERKHNLLPVDRHIPSTTVLLLNQLSRMDSVGLYWHIVMRRAYTMKRSEFKGKEYLLYQVLHLNQQYAPDDENDENSHYDSDTDSTEEIDAQWFQILPKPMIYKNYVRTVQSERKKGVFPRRNILQSDSFWKKSKSIIQYSMVKTSDPELFVNGNCSLIRQEDGSGVAFVDIGSRERMAKCYEDYTGINFFRTCEISGYVSFINGSNRFADENRKTIQESNYESDYSHSEDEYISPMGEINSSPLVDKSPATQTPKTDDKKKPKTMKILEYSPTTKKYQNITEKNSHKFPKKDTSNKKRNWSELGDSITAKKKKVKFQEKVDNGDDGSLSSLFDMDIPFGFDFSKNDGHGPTSQKISQSSDPLVQDFFQFEWEQKDLKNIQL